MDRPRTLDPGDPIYNNWAIGPNLEFSAAQFVSPPTSIRNKHGGSESADFIGPMQESIPYGSFEFNTYFMPPGKVGIAFRVQWAFPGWVNAPRLLYFTFDSWQPCSVWKIQPGPDTLLGTFPYVPTPNAWNTLRLSWLRGCTPDVLRALEVRLEQKIAGIWQTLGSAYDPLDEWVTSNKNRFGWELMTAQFNKWCYLDDTRLEFIWPQAPGPT